MNIDEFGGGMTQAVYGSVDQSPFKELELGKVQTKVSATKSRLTGTEFGAGCDRSLASKIAANTESAVLCYNPRLCLMKNYWRQ